MIAALTKKHNSTGKISKSAPGFILILQSFCEVWYLESDSNFCSILYLGGECNFICTSKRLLCDSNPVILSFL